MIVSVYIPDRCSRRTKEENLEELSSKLEIINGLIQGELLRDPHTKVIIVGDFNRHNPLQGGSHISTTLIQEESAPIINFMADRSLQNLLPVGIPTFESDAGRTSMIDLILATPGLVSKLAKCAIWEYKYGSDHRAIYTSFQVDIDIQESQERLLIKNANWDKIRDDIKRQKEMGFPTEDVDEMVDCLNSWVNKALKVYY